MTIIDFLKQHVEARITINNDEHAWICWNDDTNKWEIFFSAPDWDSGRKIFSSSDEEVAVDVLKNLIWNASEIEEGETEETEEVIPNV